MFQAYFEDKENGGLFHAVSENWAQPVNTEKHADEQFNAARTHVIGAMITHDTEAIHDAEEAVSEIIKRFEDTRNGGYFLAADKSWNIIKKEKSLLHTGEIFSVLMHLYEVSKNDSYLLKAVDFLDTACERAWDRAHGGFFTLYTDSWSVATGTKDLETQCAMLLHMNGAWKDGMDSPFGAKAALYKKQAQEFGNLLFDKTEDTVHGGFYTLFTKDWKPAAREKDVAGLAALALTLYFHYHNAGPSIWGPRRGSHAYTGRPYPPTYSYRGPAPGLDPIGDDAFRIGKKVLSLADILLEHAWDSQHGGFYSVLNENLTPAAQTKLLSTQISCLLALNVAYRLTGFPRFQQKLAEAVQVMEEKCFDAENSGVYVSFERDWTPTVRDKICGPNLMVGGILTMVGAVASGMQVAGQMLSLWIDPAVQKIRKNSSARFTVTVQNRGFAAQKVRVGGLTAPSRWMEPGDITFDLAPHEIKTYELTITPPDNMPEGAYCFELTCLPEGPVGEYISAGGKLIIA